MGGVSGATCSGRGSAAANGRGERVLLRARVAVGSPAEGGEAGYATPYPPPNPPPNPPPTKLSSVSPGRRKQHESAKAPSASSVAIGPRGWGWGWEWEWGVGWGLGVWLGFGVG